VWQFLLGQKARARDFKARNHFTDEHAVALWFDPRIDAVSRQSVGFHRFVHRIDDPVFAHPMQGVISELDAPVSRLQGGNEDLANKIRDWKSQRVWMHHRRLGEPEEHDIRSHSRGVG